MEIHPLDQNHLGECVELFVKVYLLTARDSAAEAFYNKRGFYISPKMIMMGKYLKSS
jgi:hypothetical protein